MLGKCVTLISVLSLSGCALYHENVPPVQWHTTVQRFSEKVKVTFEGTALTASSKKGIVHHVLSPDQMYCRIYYVPAAFPQGKALRQYLLSLQIPAHHIDLLETKDFSEPLTLFMDSYQRQPPTCPGWEEPMGPFSPINGEANFRCITERNLAAMIADPRTLEAGRSLGNSDANRSSKAIQDYREGKSKELKIEKIGSTRGS